jgi:hypothetical protein
LHDLGVGHGLALRARVEEEREQLRSRPEVGGDLCDRPLVVVGLGGDLVVVQPLERGPESLLGGAEDGEEPIG